MKSCSRCGEAKPATTEFFYPHKTGRNGLSPHCKVCNRKLAKVWEDGNRDLINARERARTRDPEHERERQRVWRNGPGREKVAAMLKRSRSKPEVKAKAAATSKAYRERNREALAAKQKAYRDANPDYRKNHQSRSPEKRAEYYDRYRARKMDAFVEDVFFDVIVQRDCGICGLCGEPVMGPAEVDHIVPLSQGGEHSYANTHLSHRTCNRRKHARINFGV